MVTALRCRGQQVRAVVLELGWAGGTRQTFTFVLEVRGVLHGVFPWDRRRSMALTVQAPRPPFSEGVFGGALEGFYRSTAARRQRRALHKGRVGALQ